MSKVYRFAVVGYGNIGKRHVEEINAHPEAKVVAVIDIDDSVFGTVTALPEVTYFNSLSAFISSGLEVDVVNICTPNGLHIAQSLEALQSGNHVVCEKPMGLQKMQCEELVQAAKNTDKKVFCVMQNRYSPPSQWLRSLIDEDRLGKVLMVQINCYWNRDNRYYTPGGWRGTMNMDGGPLYTQFSHFVDTLYWLFGEVENISARFENFNHQESTEFEDSGFVSFDLAQGGIGSFNYSTCAYEQNLESSITILGEKGTVKISGQYMQHLEYCNIEGYEAPELPEGNPPNQYRSGYQGSASNHFHVIENVVETLKGNAQVATGPEEGMKVVDIIERIYALR